MVRIGVDVGGTGIKLGVVSDAGQILTKESIPTQIDLPVEEQVNQITDAIIRIASAAGFSPDEIDSVGIGIPGIANPAGVIIKCTNMNWHYIPFAELVHRRLDVPVFIDNDANVAALAESVAGISKGTSSSVFITIGTGIGSGIILNGRIWNGAHGIGGELGHTILDLDGNLCTCGNHGCLERYCSANALIRIGREAVVNHPDSAILAAVQGDPEKVRARTIIDAARANDPLAVELYSRYISYLGQAVANVVNFLDPEIIVLGGGVSGAGDFLLNPLKKEFTKYVLFNDQPLPRLELAVLGADAGIIGAAMLS